MANTSATLLAGMNVLLVEDETLISFLIEDMLADLGAQQVRHGGNLAMAFDLLAARVPDIALLDVNVAGQLVFPLAEKLAELNVPFLFLTGYGRGGFDGKFSDREVIQKPFTFATLGAALSKTLASRSPPLAAG